MVYISTRECIHTVIGHVRMDEQHSQCAVYIAISIVYGTILLLYVYTVCVCMYIILCPHEQI